MIRKYSPRVVWEDTGQAALILIMIMAVVGAVSVSVAGQAVESLRTQEVSNISSQSQGAANAALELAQASKANVPSTQLGSGNVTYSATYAATGGDGFVTDAVAEGDLVEISLVGASGITAINVYWNSNSAVFASLFSGNKVTGVYAVDHSSADPDAARATVNKFGAASSGSYTFKSAAPNFNNKMTIPISLGANPPPLRLRVSVFYQASSIGIEPIGGTLVDGQLVTINSTGKADTNVVTNILYTKYSERIPGVFENVLYTNGSLTQ